MWLIGLAAQAQNRVVEGKVIDRETQAPVPFASIGLLGTSKGTSSNLNGQFSLSVGGNYSIRVSCLGYETLELRNLPPDQTVLVELKPTATQLNEVVVFNRRVNAQRVVRKAFAAIDLNYNTKPFVETFFYRHYCRDDSVYGRLIEASVDILKRKGYRATPAAAGELDEIRVTQLRRSFDNTETAQGHVPIAIKSILQADIVGYQSAQQTELLSFYSDVSNLKTDLLNYAFTFEGLTAYDGKEVYEIGFEFKRDSILTTTGYLEAAHSAGSLFIRTDNFAIVKAIDVRSWGADTITTTAYYTPFQGKYYPYHFIKEGKSVARDNSTHWFHVELMASEIRADSVPTFRGDEPTKFDLLHIPYDSTYWSNNTTLKTTPLEDDIIRDLGNGLSLNEQFARYQQFELNKIESGSGDERFNWYRNESRGNRVLYVGFWSSACASCLHELENAKRLARQFKDRAAVVLLSLDMNEQQWRRTIEKYNLSVDGFVHYRVGEGSAAAINFDLKQIPRYVLIDKNGNIVDPQAKPPTDPKLKTDLETLIRDQQP